MMASVEAARMPQVAAVHQVGARVRALRRRSLEGYKTRTGQIVQEVKAPKGL